MSQVPCLKLVIANVNPNHKLRFLFLMPATRWLADIAFAGGDNSIYVAPHLEVTYTLIGRTVSGEEFAVQAQPGQDLHFSLHRSGIVNLTVGDQQFRIRHPSHEVAQGHLATVGIQNPDGLRLAPEAEVNTLPRRYSVLPVAGFLQIGPVYLSVYRVSATAAWAMPELSDTMQMHFECMPRGKAVKYEFVVWQSAKVKPWVGDVGVSF